MRLKTLFLYSLLASSFTLVVANVREVYPVLGIRATTIPAEVVEKAVDSYKRFDKVVTGGAVDSRYAGIDAKDLRKLLAAAKNDIKYTPEVYDCDDYAVYFKARLQYLWRKAGNKDPLPIGVIYGLIVDQNGNLLYHAWNAVVLKNGKLVMVEPQGPYAFTARRAIAVVVYAIWI